MPNFFDTVVPGDPNSLFPLKDYMQNHSPEQMVVDIRASKFDPNYLPDLGDIVRMLLKEEGRPYARMLYGEGIRQLEATPSLLDPATNLLFAKRNFCACCIPDAPLEGFELICRAPELISADPGLAVMITALLVDAGQFSQAGALLPHIEKVKTEDLQQSLKEVGVDLAFVDSLKSTIDRHLSGNYEARGEALLEKAPEQVHNLLNAIAEANHSHSVYIANKAIAELALNNADWVGTAYCCLAHCLKEAERYQESLAAAETGKQRGFNLIGAWYYHDAKVSSRNFLDDFPGALKAVEEAVEFFRAEGSPGNEADHLSRKANILKQIASPLSQQEQSREAAKSLVVQAIQSICASIAITEYWQDLDEELSALSRIAARVHLEVADLRFLQEMGPTVAPVVEKYFTPTKPQSMGASEYFNRSIEARKNGNREEAARWLKRAFDLAPETSEEGRAFKAFLAYQHGVNLLKLNSLENYRPRMPLSTSQFGAAKEIRNAWNECLRLYSTIGEKHLAVFNKRFANLTGAVASIRRDELMRG
jgi:tetratricopeptide (TPR) repeat protein